MWNKLGTLSSCIMHMYEGFWDALIDNLIVVTTWVKSAWCNRMCLIRKL